MALGEVKYNTIQQSDCRGYETGIAFLRIIPHHPTENSKTEENSFIWLPELPQWGELVGLEYRNTLISAHFGNGNFPHYSKSALFEVTVI